MRRPIATAALAALIFAVPAAHAAAAPAYTNGNGIDVVSSKTLSPRLSEVRMTTKLLQKPVSMRVLLPAGYDSAPVRRWPVLYLFHGTSGGAADWTTNGDAEKTTATSPFITVMPDAGFDSDGGGWFTDWFNGGKGGLPRWESFHIGELIPFVDRNLRTLAARRGRAIYGLSQGGFGSMTYASRHPDLFVASGAFSGAVETTADPEAQALTTPIIQAITTGLNGSSDPDAIFGPRASQNVNWAAHDPGTLVANLRGQNIRLYTGDGSQGPLDPGPPEPAAVLLEGGVRQLNELFHARLEALQIPSFYDDYGPGTHTWPYWARDLRDVAPALAKVFAAPLASPARIAYRSGDGRWSAWGYDVEMRRPAREFSGLADGDARGFQLTGSGSALVRTPAAYLAGSKAAVTTRTASAERTATVTADSAGRLLIDVPLGPGNPDQQYTAASDAKGGPEVFTTRVTIDGVPRPRSCTLRRTTLKLPVAAGTQLRRVRVTIDGRRRLGARRRGRFVSVPLKGLAPGPHRVAIRANASATRRSLGPVVRAARTVGCG